MNPSAADAPGRRSSRSGRPRPGGPGATPPRRGPAWLRRAGVARILPPAILVLLCAPVLGLGYFWDDFYFLTNSASNPLEFLRPTEHRIFYRPLSQGLYFLLLLVTDPTSGWFAHCLGLALLILATLLLAALVSSLAGPREGLFAGVAFAALGAIPGLVAWVSDCQDLLAIVLILVAFHLRHARRAAGSVIAAVGALLSKEPVLTLFPVLVLWDWLLARTPRRIPFWSICFGAPALAWLALHPGLQALLAHRFQSGTTGYVGLEHPERWGLYALRYLETLANVPATGSDPRWPMHLTWSALAALALLFVGIRSAPPRPRPGAETGRLTTRRAAVLSLLLAIPPLVLPTLLVRHWAPYFACISGIGMALGLGVLLGRVSPPLAAFSAGAFLLLGIWCRGMEFRNEPVWTEKVFVEAYRSATAVRDHFRALHPTLPHGSQVLVSVTATGFRGIRWTLLDANALRVWYSDHTIRTLLAERRLAGAPYEALMRVTDSLTVIDIDPERLTVRWSGTDAPQPAEISRPIRNYARGVAASGDPERAARILGRFAEIEKGMNRDLDLRLAGMVLSAAGRDAEAKPYYDAAKPFPRETALEIVKKLLTETTDDARQDSCAFAAFGLYPLDPDASRYLMRRFREERIAPAALHFALRLQAMNPGDRESRELAERIRRRLAHPVPGDPLAPL